MTPLTRMRRTLFALAFCACEISTPLIGLLLMNLLRVRFGHWIDRIAPLIWSLRAVIVYLALKDNDSWRSWSTIAGPGRPAALALLRQPAHRRQPGHLRLSPALAALTVGSVSACHVPLRIAGGTRSAAGFPPTPR